MQLVLRQFDLPLKRVFTIARGSMEVQRALVVELRQDGRQGFGEAGESAYYGASRTQLASALERLRPRLEAHRLESPEGLWEELDAELSRCRFAQCALDQAAYDLWGKLRQEPVWKLWGLSLENVPPSDYTIGISPIDVRLRELADFPGWPVYKIKLGRADDLDVVRRLRLQTAALFRVDANGAWGVEETVRNSRVLVGLGVEFIEQPLPPDDWDGMQAVYRQSALPLVADESCRIESDVDRCRGCFHGINIKLVKCGGLTPARRMIARARQLGLKVMVGCMVESTVGISAIAQLLPLLDYVDMDGPQLLARDIASGVKVERGRVLFSEENGCGVRLLPEADDVGSPSPSGRGLG
jgi:L-alanine-DL-glutamate epimerase-like enolase superfamily enzyme